MKWLWWLPSILITALMLTGAGGAYLRVLEPGPGFYLFGMAFPIAALCALVLSAAAALATARGLDWRGAAVRGAGLPIAVCLLLLVLMPRAQSNPIHDVATDPSIGFPPEIMKLREPEDHAAVLAKQAELYPDIKPLELPERSRDEVMLLALRVANSTPGWSVTESDPERGRIFGTAESSIFHFVDDISILVEHHPVRGSIVQMRSRSRIGQSDLGANAERIRTFLAAVKEAAG